MVASVDLAALLSTCIDAASRGCAEIRGVHRRRVAAGGALSVVHKAEDDVRSALTEADMRDAARARTPLLATVTWLGLGLGLP